MTRRSEDEFLDELEELFLKQGFARLTIGDVAAEMRCSRRRLYQHAQTKDELFLKVLDRFFTSIRAETVRKTEATSDYTEKVDAFLKSGELAARRASSQFMADIDADPLARKLFDDHVRVCISNLVGILEDGVEAGDMVDFNTRVIAEALFAAAQRLRDPSLLESLAITYEDALIELGRLARVGIAVRKK